MLKIQSLTRLKTKQNIDMKTLPDGIMAVFTGSLDSKLATTVLDNIEENYDKYQELGLSVFFATQDDLETDSQAILYDPNREFASTCSILSKKQDQCDALIIFEKKGTELTHLYTRENPEYKYDWIAHIIGMATNYQNPEPDAQNLWRFGQRVTKPGEYLCVDCGYIDSFDIGDIFPVCEVCLSGDPDGPTDGPEQGYWEYLT